MEKESVDREDLLRLLGLARRAARNSYKGERLKGVETGLNIAERMIDKAAKESEIKNEE